MIYTSNYVRSAKYALSYAISVKPPEWYVGKCLPQLAPTWDMVNQSKSGRLTHAQYTEQYINLLSKRRFTPDRVMDALPDNSRLLCYESPGEFCHRRILAQWIQDELGLIISEWVSEEDMYKEQLINDLLEF
jgi:hypothetical protein